MRLGELFVVMVLGFAMTGCGVATGDGAAEISSDVSDTSAGDRQYLLERVDDAAVVQLYADGFEALDIREKILIWHLYQAALAGRDIFYDQRYAHNLEMREVLEEIVTMPTMSTQRSLVRSFGIPSCSGSTPVRSTT